MKKTEHITINLTSEELAKLQSLARKQRQTLTACAYWLVVDHLPNEQGEGVQIEYTERA